MKWNTYEKQRYKQVSKNESYSPFGGVGFYYISRWTRIKLALFMLIGIDIKDIHVDIINSSVKNVEKWVEQNRTPEIIEAFKKAADIIEAFKKAASCRQDVDD
jgi:prephenate dehydrogenase